MRLYGKKFAKQFIDGRVKKTTETRDAVLWDIDWSTFQARVKIQGSNEYVIAHFPRNWVSRPYWLKEGNAVRILHRQGVRGFVEVIGEGRAVPTPIEGDVFPPAATLPDAILSGLEMSEAAVPNMGVVVTTGTFRINNVVYSFTPDDAGYIIMDDPAPMFMGSNNLMGVGEVSVSFETAPTADGFFRYDMVVIGEDTTLDYVSGETSITPVKPDIPSNHLQVGDYVLVQFDVTSILNSDIGKTWIARYPVILEFNYANLTGTISGEYFFEWDAGGSTPEITVGVTVKDQYGLDLPAGAGSYNMDLESTGTGDIYSSDTGYHPSQVSQSFGSSSYDFKYRRDQTVAEESCGFKATLNVSGKNRTRGGFIILLNSGGGPIAF